MTLKRIFEVSITEAANGHADRRRTCIVLADDEREARSLIPRSQHVVEIKADPGLVSAKGRSRIVGWVSTRAAVAV